MAVYCFTFQSEVDTFPRDPRSITQPQGGNVGPNLDIGTINESGYFTLCNRMI